MEISGDNPHKTPNLYLLLKPCLVLEYWSSLIPTCPHFSPNHSLFSSIPDTLPLPSALGIGILWGLGESRGFTLSPGDYPHLIPTKPLVPGVLL
jgi:hypothetical protein